VETVTIAEANWRLPENITAIIQNRGLKYAFVAEKSGLSKQQFSDMLRGRKIIKPSDVLSIANALGVSAGDLFREEM